ncbi:MAG: cytochrome P450 [Acidimicrobiales bacterium]
MAADDQARAMMEDAAPVNDWATDWDHHDEVWVADPYPIWTELRDRCPMAHTNRYNEGVWLPLSYDQIDRIAHDTDSFSSNHFGFTAGGSHARAQFPPIHSDPPEHRPMRRTILPFFAPKRIETWEASITEHCTELAQAVAASDTADAAIDYAQHIPVGAIAAILGLPAGDGELFRRWIVQFLEIGGRDPDARTAAEKEIRAYMAEQMATRRAHPGNDLISHLLQAEVDGEPLGDDLIERMLMLQLVAGIDTTWSSIGAGLWHLAGNPEDRQRLLAEPELIPTAVEEILRAYAPVNVARRVTTDVAIDGVTMKEGDTVMMTFPIACRDPELFDRADDVVIDRERNRHVAFGSGIHRCLGSNLARLEMNVAIRVWLEHIPEFRLDPDRPASWSEGQIRGPRSIPILIGS